jgi:hemolysin D
MTRKFPLWERYRQAWGKAWAERLQTREGECQRHEQAFLPAVLALQARPPHPTPQLLQKMLLGALGLLLLWACLGQVDVVATATGKVVPSGKSKVIQASEIALVKAIHVEDGQRVQAGQLLVELDAQGTQADVTRWRSDLLSANVDAARAQAMLDAIRDQREPELLASSISDADGQQLAKAKRWLDGQFLELRSSVDQAAADIERLGAEIRGVEAAVLSLQQSLPIARQLASDYQLLWQEKSVPKHAFFEKEQRRIDQERELALTRLRVEELQAARKSALSRRESVIAQARRSMLDLLNESQQRAMAVSQELAKADVRHGLRQLTAPVAGTIQQLAIHTRGGVVTQAQALMIVVPDDQPVEVEALIDNKDIGFIRPGQPVEVKIETFTFTRYGVVEGSVNSLSKDAIEDEQGRLRYSARISLKDSVINIHGRPEPLFAGMAAKVEIKTDRRSVVSYFLGPLQEYARESLAER